VVPPDGPVRWIESFGQTFFEGDTVERRPVRLIGIHADITESKLAELRITEMNRVLDSQLHELQLALTQKTILIQEVQHRVKNNLQIISSLLSLEAKRFEDDAVRKPLEESRDRVRAMALMHEQFCHSDDLSRIDFAGFVDRLTSYFLNSHGIGSSKIQLSTDKCQTTHERSNFVRTYSSGVAIELD
jgi:two-component sensor histidine kinase